MLYLATASGPKVHEAMAAGLIGQMVTYRSPNRLVPGAPYAIDNGRVILRDGHPRLNPDWSPVRWQAHLARLADEKGCVFATVPDVVGDAAATDELWGRWAPVVEAVGHPAAYVAQNGCERIPDDAEVVFLGGDTDWKLGPAARRIASAAKRAGLWLHGGRVNTRRRLRYMADIGCDSADGTLLAFGPDINLPRLCGWLDPDQGSFGGVA